MAVYFLGVVFHIHVIALFLQADIHGGVSFSGLQGAHVYFIFFRCSSFMVAVSFSSMSITVFVISMAFWGHCFAHSPHPLHLSESMAM